MKVICPKCQFENQADSTRVVCARCATIIEVRVDQGSGFDANGKRQTARLPFAANSSNSGNLQSGNFSSGNSGSLSNPLQNRDVYATRVGDDFDDVLDIPRPQQGEFHNTAEATPVFEDVFSTNYDSSANYDFSAYEKKSAAPSDVFQSEAASQRVTQDYTAPAEPEFMGWPVLPENNLDDEEELVGGTTSSRGGLAVRVLIILAAFGVLGFLAYYFLWDYYIKQRQTQVRDVDSSVVGNARQPQQPTQSGAPVDTNQQTSSPILQPKNPQSTGSGSANPGKSIDIPPVPVNPPQGPKGPSTTVKQTSPETTPGPSIPEPSNRGNLTIQVGSYPEKEQADQRIARLKSSNLTARIERVDLQGKGTYYRVQVGKFLSRDDAGRYANLLRTKGLVQDYIVVTIGK